MRLRMGGGRGMGRAAQSGSSRLIMAAVMVVGGLFSYDASRQKNPITGRTQAIALNPQQEVALGLRTAPQMAQKFGGDDPDREDQGRVQTVGEKLVRSSAASKSPYQFKFTPAGRPQDGERLRVARRPHLPSRARCTTASATKRSWPACWGTRSATWWAGTRPRSWPRASSARRSWARWASPPPTSTAARGGMAQAAAAMVNQMVQLKYGREDELQSDSLGVNFMSDASYDPHALIAVMDILAKASGGQKRAEFTSSHPDPGNRSQVIKEEIAKRYPGGVPSSLTLGPPLEAGAAASR